jgi:hypothetical protein
MDGASGKRRAGSHFYNRKTLSIKIFLRHIEVG